MPLDDRRGEADRSPPASFEAERGLLGGILVDNRALEGVAEFLRPEHFADPLHGRLYEIVADIVGRNGVASPAILKARADGLEIPGGAVPYIARLAAVAVSRIDVADYGREVFALYQRRKLIEVAKGLEAAAYDTSGDATPAEIQSEAESAMFALAQAGATDTRLASNAVVVDETLHRVETAWKERALPADQRPPRIETGIAELDDVLSIRPKQLIVIGGAPSMGKSALADCIAQHNERRGLPTALFIQEMGREEWQTRRLARETGIPTQAIETGALSDGQMAAVLDAGAALRAMPAHFDDTTGLRVSQLRSRLRRLVRRHGVMLAIVDYIQLMRAENAGRGANRNEVIGELTRGLKEIAGELGIPIIALSQIKRIAERDDKRPTLDDLRESGSIEQDANTVIFVHREEYYLSRSGPVGKGGKPASPDEVAAYDIRLDASRGKAEVIIGKQRGGQAPAIVRTAFEGVRTRFSTLPKPVEQPDMPGIE